MDDDKTAFPASEKTPGQSASRSAYARLMAQLEKLPWAAEYLELRAEGWDWRKAAYIAWAASPVGGRWPESQEALARQVLGLKSDRTIRKWRARNPAIDERVAVLQVAPLMRHRRDVIEALIQVASTPEPSAHQDRKLFLQMTGDFTPRQELSGPEGEPIEVRQIDYRAAVSALAPDGEDDGD